MSGQNDLNVNGILESLLQTVESNLKSSLKEEAEACVKTAIDDFNKAVKECKQMIFDATSSLAKDLKSMLEQELTKARKEYEEELSKIHDQLFTNPNSLLQKIRNEAKLLKHVCVLLHVIVQGLRLACDAVTP